MTQPQQHPQLPPVVYVPCGRPGAEPTESTIELRRTDNGKTALLVYSALDRLIACCGPHQPWMLVANENLNSIYGALPFDVIMLDADLPQYLRHQPQAV